MANNKAWWISIAASALLVVGVFAATFGAGLRFYIVSSPSMGMTAPVGTLVAVRGQASYAIGEVVSYARSGTVYTHRIVDITEQGFITQGDINASPDALPVAQSQIVGSVTFIGKNLGFLVEALPWLVLSLSTGFVGVKVHTGCSFFKVSKSFKVTTPFLSTAIKGADVASAA